MPAIIYTAHSPSALDAIVQASHHQMSKQMIIKDFLLPSEGDIRYMSLSKSWRVLQSMLTGVDSPDNEFLTETFDGQHYLHGWSNHGAAWTSAEQVANIADILDQINFQYRLECFHEYQNKIGRCTSQINDNLFSDSHEFNGILEKKRQTELKTYFQQLCDFYRASAKRGDGLIVEFV